MTDELLIKVLKRFKREDFTIIGDKWGKFSVDQLDRGWQKLTKINLIRAVINVINVSHVNLRP